MFSETMDRGLHFALPLQTGGAGGAVYLWPLLQQKDAPLTFTASSCGSSEERHWVGFDPCS